MEVRKARKDDLSDVLRIYNQGIEDRIATLEMDQKDLGHMEKWFQDRGKRYSVFVVEHENEIAGWASLNQYSARCAYDGVAELSIYIDRSYRGKGIGRILLEKIENEAKENGFYKIVLFTFPFNQFGQGLYRRAGYREVGVFKNQGILDGKFVDIMIMEKLLSV